MILRAVEIEFKNISPSYQTEHQPITKNLSLHIGAVKDISKLLPRFHNVTDGTVAVNIAYLLRNTSHRLSTIRNAYCIYVMEYGQLVKAGQHEQLLEKNKIYTALW